MCKKIIEDLAGNRMEKEKIKEALSALRSEIKDPGKQKEAQGLIGDGAWLIAMLSSDEPKVRKNAALLLGDLKVQQALSNLYAAYCVEETLFVKSAYLTAMGKLDAKEYAGKLKERQMELSRKVPAENEKKHLREEMRELEKILVDIEGVKKHTFRGFSEAQNFLLTTSREQRNITLAEVKALSTEVSYRVSEHPLGVLVQSRQLSPFLHLRTYRELLFPLKAKVPANPREAAAAVERAGIVPFLFACYKEETPFYFRLELKSRMELDKKTDFAKKFAAELEDLTGRKLINSTKNYEVEIRLAETKEGSFLAFLKLYTIPMKRFSYRKNAIAASIHPANAAVLMNLAKPYLKEDAQILDPFCGVGTMLIERDYCVPAREKYGIDTFGDAIVMARENAALAGEKINFIHRDYFDFKHAYLFDEIITNMPMRGKKTREEQDAFYVRFFDKSQSILSRDGIIIMYSNEQGFVKKQLRLRDNYRLLQEFCIREKDGFYLYIIGIKG